MPRVTPASPKPPSRSRPPWPNSAAAFSAAAGFLTSWQAAPSPSRRPPWLWPPWPPPWPHLSHARHTRVNDVCSSSRAAYLILAQLGIAIGRFDPCVAYRPWPRAPPSPLPPSRRPWPPPPSAAPRAPCRVRVRVRVRVWVRVRVRDWVRVRVRVRVRVSARLVRRLGFELGLGTWLGLG